MKKRNCISPILIFSIVLSLFLPGSSQTVFAAKGGRVTKINSNSPTGITQEEMLDQEPDFYSLMNKKTKKPGKRTDTVSRVKAKANKRQTLYLWDKGNVPAQTKYTKNDGDYFDSPSFVPYLTAMPAKKGTKVKGAVVLCAGGAFMFHGNYTDSIPVAEELNKRGYHCFIVDPQPVLIIGTYDADGNPDAMNAAWGGQYGPNQIMLCLSEHKTTENIRLKGAFTVSFATAHQVAASDYVGIVSAKDAPDKMEKSGFTTVSVDERILAGEDKIDAAKLDAIIFDPANAAYLRLGEKVGNAFSDGARLK